MITCCPPIHRPIDGHANVGTVTFSRKGKRLLDDDMAQRLLAAVAP